MRRIVITPQTEHRIDKIIIEAYGTYDWNKVAILQFFNPQVDFLWLVAGTSLWIPDENEIAEIRNFRGYYDIVRN